MSLSSLNFINNNIHDWLFEKKDVRPLIFCRIGYGLILFFAYLFRWSELTKLYGPNGYGGLFYYQRTGDVISNINPLNYFSIYLFQTEFITYVLYLTLLVSAIFYVVGYKTKLSGSIALILHVLFVSRAGLSSWGWSYLIQPMILYTLLSPIDKIYSVDSFGKIKNLDDEICSAWCLRLIQFNICTMYFKAGYSHVLNPHWQNGEMVYLGLMIRFVSRIDMNLVFLKPVLIFANYYSYIIEAIAPFTLFIRKISPYIAVGLILMHLSIEFILTIDWWSYLMITSLMTFIPSSWFDKILIKFRPKQISSH